VTHALLYAVGSHGGTPLHHAAKRGLDQAVNLLLSNGGISTSTL